MEKGCGKEEEVAKRNKEQWKPPKFDWIKINYDGACIVQNKSVVCGVVARNKEGKVLAGMGKWFETNEAEVAEAMAIKQSVKLVMEKGYQKVVIESHAKNLVDGINGKEWRSFWKTAPIVKNIKEYLRNIREVKLDFVTRNANTVGHWITQRTVKRMCPLVWVFQPPSSFVYVLSNDGLPAPPLE